MLSALQTLQQDFPSLIADVRGIGLFAGLEVVACPLAKIPAPLAAKALKEGAKARGVLLSADGPVGHVVKIKPPMVFGTREVDAMVKVMRWVDGLGGARG
jgi:4-aminobutyrate aminotransferase-like enzyme